MNVLGLVYDELTARAGKHMQGNLLILMFSKAQHEPIFQVSQQLYPTQLLQDIFLHNFDPTTDLSCLFLGGGCSV